MSQVKKAFDQLVSAIVMSMTDIEPTTTEMVRVMNTYHHENDGWPRKNYYDLNDRDDLDELNDRLGLPALLEVGKEWGRLNNEGNTFVIVSPSTNKWKLLTDDDIYGLFSENMSEYVRDVLTKPHLEGYGLFYDLINA